MSCFIMNHSGTRELGYTLAECMNRFMNGNEYTIATAAACGVGLEKAFADCFIAGRYNPEKISESLHFINAAAYAERYKENSLAPFSDPDPRRNYSRWHMPEYNNGDETPAPWHYALACRLDCWLYQTSDGNAAIADKRLAVKAFAEQLYKLIVNHSAEYKKCRWGE